MKLLKFVLVSIVLLLVVGYARTWQVQNSSLQQEFVEGELPIFGLNGFYFGTAPFPTGSWLGKRFHNEENRGINIFRAAHDEVERYPFKTSLGKGLQDFPLEVYKLDYNDPRNPFWVRPVLDELVQTGQGRYLGKMHYRLIPGFPFTLTFFRLESTD